MLLTLKDMQFLSTVLETDTDGKDVAKSDLTAEQREKLRDLDEVSVITYGKHLIKNYNEIND